MRDMVRGRRLEGVWCVNNSGSATVETAALQQLRGFEKHDGDGDGDVELLCTWFHSREARGCTPGMDVLAQSMGFVIT